MPNIKSAKKRNITSKVANAQNRAVKTALRSQIRKFDAAVVEGSGENAAAAYKVAVKHVDRAAARGLIHKNKAANAKSAMTLKLNSLNA